MKHLIERVLIVIAILVLGTICVRSIKYSLLLYQTLSATKNEAIAAMNQHERVWLNNVKLVHKGMVYQDVVRILGQPTKRRTNNYIAWVVEDNDDNYSEISIEFDNDQVKRGVWVHLNKFYYALPL